MITMMITMHARPEKRRELLQTLSGLLPLLEKELGYRDAHVYMERERAHHLKLVEVWDTQQDVEQYMQSDYFAVLRGAMQLLTTSSDITISSDITFKQVPQIDHMAPIFMDLCQECMTMNECRVPMFT